jgi:hypothetical protein
MMFLSVICFFQVVGQDIGLLNMKGNLPATLINPAFTLEKKFNISFPTANIQLMTDGPSINKLTSINALGNRYIDVSKIDESLSPTQNIFFSNDIRTFDLSLKTGVVTWMAGHAFRSSANIRYPKGLVELLSQGNAPFVGQKIDIGTAVDAMAYNELYLGAQTARDNFSIGIKVKMLSGVAALQTEKSDIEFETKSEFYQLVLNNDFSLHSSGFLEHFSNDSIKVDYSHFAFDHLFYNNLGFAIDLGATFKIGENIVLSASALDVGRIKWNYEPQKYSSTGVYTFEGIDITDLFGDTISISIGDSLKNIVQLTTEKDAFSTFTNSRFCLGGSYQFNKNWMFNAWYMLGFNFENKSHSFSVSALRKFSFIDVGISYKASKNNFSNIGLYSRLKVGNFSVFLNSENIAGLIKPLDTKFVSLTGGMTFQF